MSLKSQTLTNFIEKTIYVYNTKYIKYETASYDESNDIYECFFSTNMVKVCEV